MKKQYLFLILSILFISPSMVFANTIDLNVYLSGDKLSPGSSIYVDWKSEGIDPSKNLDLYLESSEKGFLYPVARNLPLNGNYNWVIPNDTVTANDYRLSLSTADKGPSASSNNSSEFAIYSDSDTYSIVDFSAGLAYEGYGEEGRIDVEFKTSRPLTKQYYLSLNISCTEGIEIVGESAKTKCNSWVGVNDTDEKYSLKYKNNINKESHINFVLDLYKDGNLVQTKFIGPFSIPAAKNSNTFELNDKNYINNNLQKDLEKWGDIRFINPKEGQKTIKKIEAGQTFILKWKNIIKPSSSDVSLYKYDKEPSKEHLRNGPNNAVTGLKVLDLGVVYSDSKEMKFTIPSNLESGFYYFKFNGKGFGDNSPAIEIIGAEKNNDIDPNLNNGSEKSLSKYQKLEMIESLFGKNSEAYRIISLLIDLGIIN